MQIDAIDNLALVENGLQHLSFELSRPRPSYFRLAREAHLLLYRSMIEALKGTANFAVTGSERAVSYQTGNEAWKEIHKVPVGGCRRAWRVSDPSPCSPPAARERQVEPGNSLIGFYDALAMIQTECFMGQYTHSKVVPVSDDEMKTLEWLHGAIRNQYEHFVPKHYQASVVELLAATSLCLRLARQLLFHGHVLFREPSRKELENLFSRVESAIGPASELM